MSQQLDQAIAVDTVASKLMLDQLKEKCVRIGSEQMKGRILEWGNANAKALDDAGLTTSLLKAIS